MELALAALLQALVISAHSRADEMNSVGSVHNKVLVLYSNTNASYILHDCSLHNTYFHSTKYAFSFYVKFDSLNEINFIVLILSKQKSNYASFNSYPKN